MNVFQTIEEAQAAFEKITTEKTEVETKLADALQANAGLVAEIEKLSQNPVVKKVEEKIINLADHVFEFAGQKFGFNFPKLTLKDKTVVTPVEVKADTKLQEMLINSNSSMLKPLNKQ